MTKLFEWVKSNKLVTIWFISGFIFFVGYSISTWSGLNWQALDWHVLTGIATWILAGGVFLAFSQIREARKSTNIQIATAL
ncbi:MAG: hypothetical protein U1D67_05280, partial [Dehalococcoidia bacterium]|nr:hypothetical protein [Dehalococcoidia bacterium]